MVWSCVYGDTYGDMLVMCGWCLNVVSMMFKKKTDLFKGHNFWAQVKNKEVIECTLQSPDCIRNVHVITFVCLNMGYKKDVPCCSRF